jgi:hypothetical protein
VFRLAFAGIGPTELRILLAFGACYVSADPWIDVAGWRMLLLDVSAVAAIAGLVAVFVVSAVRTTRTLYRAEPLPGENHERVRAGRTDHRCREGLAAGSVDAAAGYTR